MSDDKPYGYAFIVIEEIECDAEPPPQAMSDDKPYGYAFIGVEEMV